MVATSDSIGSVIDQLLTVDFHKQGVITELYDAATSRYGRSPTSLAAERLRDALDEGDDVFILTGFLLEPSLAQETDGPVGAAALARVLKTEFGVHPTILADEAALETVKTATQAYGLKVTDRDGAREAAATCSTEPIPIDRGEAERTADRLLESDPAAVIAIERPGANHLGEYHMLGGTNITDDIGKAEPLIERTDALTIGIGDGGNEIGMGSIHSRVRDVVARSESCGCGCGGGVAATSEVDVLVPVTVSNWGAHGLIAALSALRGDNLLLPAEMEKRALRQCGLAGAVDGVSGRTDGSCDNLSVATNGAIVDCLHDIVESTQY